MEFILSEEDLIKNNNIKVLYFYANWMPFHKKMLVMLNKMEEKYNNILYFAIDTDFFKSLPAKYKVSSIPTIIFLKDNKEVNRLTGIVMTSVIKNAFVNIV